MQNKEKEILFNEKIDNAINGYALAITFMGISIFLLNNLNYFGNEVVSKVVLVICAAIGVLGTFTELDKNDTIKGLGDLGVGLILFIPWLLIYIYVKSIFLNVIGFIICIIGVYGMIRGIIKVIVSIFYVVPPKERKFKSIGINFFTALPAIASFVLVVFNIIKIALEIKSM